MAQIPALETYDDVGDWVPVIAGELDVDESVVWQIVGAVDPSLKPLKTERQKQLRGVMERNLEFDDRHEFLVVTGTLNDEPMFEYFPNQHKVWVRTEEQEKEMNRVIDSWENAVIKNNEGDEDNIVVEYATRDTREEANFALTLLKQVHNVGLDDLDLDIVEAEIG